MINMPAGDGTGPDGKGSRTGRGLGICAGHNTPGYTKSTGRGLVRGIKRNFRRSRGNRRSRYN